MRDPHYMVGCVLSQLKPSELYILSLAVKNTPTLFTAKTVELLGLYRICNIHTIFYTDGRDGAHYYPS